jgi:DHA1 family bicyclomycin/chloramphenicol resistance-like MFS transporter
VASERAAIDEAEDLPEPPVELPAEPILPVAINPPQISRPAMRVLPFAIALLTQVLAYWSVDIMSPALPNLKDDLALSATGAGLIFSLFFVGRLVGTLPAAFLAERIGAPRTALIGAALATAGALLALSASGETLLLPARMLQGGGVALMVTAALLSLVRLRPGQGAAMTYFGFAATIGGVFGLVSGGLLTSMVGWRGVFALSAILGVAAAISAFQSGRPTPAPAAMSAMPATPADRAQPSGMPRSVVVFLLANLLVYFNYAIWVALPLYADKVFNASPTMLSALLLTVTLVHLVAAFPCGRIIRAWGSRRSLLAGLTLSLLGTSAVLIPTEAIWLALPMIPYGVGQVLASNAAGDLVLHGAGRGGRAVGIVRLSSDLGLVLGPYISGTLQDAAGYRAPFAILPVFTVIAGLLIWRVSAGQPAPTPELATT